MGDELDELTSFSKITARHGDVLDGLVKRLEADPTLVEKIQPEIRRELEYAAFITDEFNKLLKRRLEQ